MTRLPLDEVIHLFVLSHEPLLDPEKAAGMCGETSYEFARWLDSHGYPWAQTIVGQKDGQSHMAIEYNLHVYDFTLRQFEPDADVPTVTPVRTWQREWQREWQGE